MPTCTICQADGILQISNTWYCVDHLEDGFLAVAEFLAIVRGWDRADTATALTNWMAE